jgi:hypothetical protein
MQVYRVLNNKGKLLIVGFPKGSRAEGAREQRYSPPRQIEPVLSRATFGESGVSCPYGEELLLFAWAEKEDCKNRHKHSGPVTDYQVSGVQKKKEKEEQSSICYTEANGNAHLHL